MVLNVGPDPRGRFPQESKEVLAAIGSWLRANGESIYGTHATAIRQPWGVGTGKPGNLYLHVFHRPTNNRLLIPQLARSAVKKVTMLEGRQPLTWHVNGSDIVVQLPANLRPSPNTVFKVEHNAPLPNQRAPTILSPEYEGLLLTPGEAELIGGARLMRVSNSGYYGVAHPFMSVEGLTSPSDGLTWQIQVPSAGVFAAELEYSATPEQAGQQGALTIGEEVRYFEVLETGPLRRGKVTSLHRQPLGAFRVTRPGTYKVSIRPDRGGKGLFTLKQIKFRPLAYP